MPKRKLIKETPAEDSDLSPAPEGFIDQETTDVTTVNGSSPTKRRKVKDEAQAIAGSAQAKKRAPSARSKVAVKPEPEEEEEEPVVESPKPKKRAKKEVKEEVKTEEGREGAEVEKKVVRKRKTKDEKKAEEMPLAARTLGHKLFIGAHVSSAGGVQNAVGNSVHIGANAFALFLKSQRKWANPPLADDQCSGFHANCKSHSYEQGKYVVPHGSYLVNMAHTDKDRTEQAYTSYLDDLKRCEKLGISLYNIHPGNTVSNDRAEAIAHLAKNINRAHSETSTVITLLENMAAGGNVLGSTFEDLRDIIGLVSDKARIGVCIDTCHAFAGGYDLRTPAAFKETFKRFDDIVGFKYLRAMHINDSKAPFDSHRDLHANIGTGFLGLRTFHNLVNDSRFEGIPLVLETPITVTDDDGVVLKDEKGKEKEDKQIWANEIKLLENLVGIDTESEEFLTLEKQLARKGEPERNRLMEQQDRKREKEEKKKAKVGAKKKGGKQTSSGSDDSEALSD
jgi:AP endonuclease-1